MLIVEGPDMLGKTTLCNALTRTLEALRPERGPIARDKFGVSESTFTVAQYRERTKPWTVCDRFHISEVLYGSELRGASNLTCDQVLAVQGAIASVGGMVVCVEAWDTVYDTILTQKLVERPQAFDAAQLAQVNRAFIRACDGHGRYGVYRFQIDAVHTLGHFGAWPAANDEFVAKVAWRYAQRQRAVCGEVV